MDSAQSGAITGAKLVGHAESGPAPEAAMVDELLADQLLADEAELGMDSQQVRGQQWQFSQPVMPPWVHLCSLLQSP